MGFEQRVSTLVEPYELVVELDPAIDQGVADWEDKYRLYKETGDQQALTSILKPGQKPTTFRLQHLRGAANHTLRKTWAGICHLKSRTAIDASLPDIYWLGCQLALIGWENLRGPGGGDIHFTEQVDEDTRIRHASDEAMATLLELDATGRVPYQIGARVWEVTFLPPK